MQWEKSPEALAELFHAALPADPRVERRKMFGYPAAFVGGNMFAGLHGPRMVVRLPDAPRQELLTVGGAMIFEPMPGRPMREYVVIPPVLVANAAELSGWLSRSFDHAAALPSKSKAPKKKPAAKGGRAG